MKKFITDWEWLSIRILTLGATVFLWSYITEIEGAAEILGDHWGKEHSWHKDLTYLWGFRHWVYTTTFTILTTVQAIRIGVWTNCKINDKGFETSCKEK